MHLSFLLMLVRSTHSFRTSTLPSARLQFARFSETTPQGVKALVSGKIEAALSPTSLEVLSATDDPNGAHVAIKIVSDRFEGKSAVQRQQLVYKAIWDEMQSKAVLILLNGSNGS